MSRFRTTGQLAPPKQLERLSTGILKSDENSVSLPIECVNESNEGNADANTEDCEKPVSSKYSRFTVYLRTFVLNYYGF